MLSCTTTAQHVLFWVCLHSFNLARTVFCDPYILTHSDLSLFVTQHLSALHFVLHVKLQLNALCCSVLFVQLQLGTLRFVLVFTATSWRALFYICLYSNNLALYDLSLFATQHFSALYSVFACGAITKDRDAPFCVCL